MTTPSLKKLISSCLSESCKLPGRNNLYSVGGPGWISCHDEDNPCAMCFCQLAKEKDKIGRLIVEKDRCKKPKMCRKVCDSFSQTGHDVGTSWNCWLPGWRFEWYLQLLVFRPWRVSSELSSQNPNSCPMVKMIWKRVKFCYVMHTYDWSLSTTFSCRFVFVLRLKESYRIQVLWFSKLTTFSKLARKMKKKRGFSTVWFVYKCTVFNAMNMIKY